MNRKTVKKITEAVVQRCSIKKVLIKFLQNSQENTCARVSFLIKLQTWKLWHRCFPGNFAKFLGALFFIEHLWWLLLELFINGYLLTFFNILMIVYLFYFGRLAWVFHIKFFYCSILFRWGTHLYMSLFPSFCLSARSSRTIYQEPCII